METENPFSVWADLSDLDILSVNAHPNLVATIFRCVDSGAEVLYYTVNKPMWVPVTKREILGLDN